MDKTKSLKASGAAMVKNNNLTLANVCHLQLDTEPVATPAVTSIAETPKPELPSLGILG